MFWSWRIWLKRVMGGSRTTCRRRRLEAETLEERVTPTMPAAVPFYIVAPLKAGAQPAVFPWTDNNVNSRIRPMAIDNAYGLNLLPAADNGAGQTIAVIDAYNDPALVSSTAPTFLTSDLHIFDQTFGLPDPVFEKVSQTGSQVALPPVDPAGPGTDDWEVEESLDVEWAHAMAPGAKIILVECNDPTTLDTGAMWAAKPVASGGGGASVVSMSFGIAGGFGGETADDADFSPATYPGVTFLASTDDTGSQGSPVPQAAYPADSPNVVAVGGTSLNINPTTGAFISESVWNDGFVPTNLPPSFQATGGGISNFEAQPAYQAAAAAPFSTTNRTAPDVSFLADPDTGVAVYDSYDGPSNPDAVNNWLTIGGTSLACPCWGGIISIVDQLRANASEAPLTGATQTLPELYSIYGSPDYANDFRDITTGNNGTYNAGVGYDLATGIGTPIANQLIPALANTSQLGYTAPAGTNDFLLKQNGTILDLFDNSLLVSSESAASVTSVVITGGTDNTLTIDYSGGQFTANVTFDGGTGLLAHSVTIENGSFTKETYTPAGPAAGAFNLDGAVITFTDCTAVVDVSTAVNLDVGVTNTSELISVVNGPLVNAAQTTTVSTTSGTFPSIEFANQLNVAVQDVGGADTFTMNDTLAGTGLATLALDGGTISGVSFDVDATPADVITSMVGDSSDVTVDVGDAGSVQSIAGTLKLQNNAGANNAVIIDDSSDATPQTATFTSGTITGLAPGAIDVQTAGTQSLTVNGGTGGNQFNVLTIDPGVLVVINGGSGSDAFIVNPQAPLTSLTINGQDPTTTPGDSLFYAGAGVNTPTGVGSGFVTQPGEGLVGYTGIESVATGADLGLSTVTVAPVSVPAGTLAFVTLTARGPSGIQEALGGLNVQFSLGAGSATGTLGSFSDNGDGTYTTTFTGILVGTITIVATIDGQPLTSAPAVVTVTPGAFSLAQSTVSITPGSIVSGAAAVATLVARDRYGNLETAGDLTVAFGLGAGTATGNFSAPVYAGNGAYTATFTGVLTGTDPVIAFIDGQTLTSTPPTITVTAGPFSLAQSSVAVSPASFAVATTTTITLTVRDAAGNVENAGGLLVQFYLSGTGNGAFTPVVDHHNGTYTTILTGTTIGTDNVLATIDLQNLTSTPPILTITPGPVSLIQSAVAVTPASIPAGGAATVTLTARDSLGNLEGAGLAITFGMGAGNLSGSFGPTIDNGNGTYSAIFTASDTPGTGLIVGSIAGQTLISNPAGLIVTPAAASTTFSTLAVTPGSIASGTAAVVTLSTYDIFDNQETGGGLQVTFHLGAGTATGSFSNTVDNHNGTYSAFFTGGLIGTNTISADIGTQVVTSAPTITVTPGAVSLAQSIIMVVPASIQAGASATVTLQTRDAAGNLETSGGIPIGFSLATGAGASGAFSGFTDLGNGSYTVTFTGAHAGTNSIVGFINSDLVTPPAAITVTPGATWTLLQSTP